jgi:hypothetical protein
MAYFPDFSPYSYGRGQHPNVFHIGWLDRDYPFPTGPIDPSSLTTLRILAKAPVEQYRGKHLCNLCSEPAGLVKKTVKDRVYMDPSCSWAVWAAQRSGNGEIRVQSDKHVFAAPVLIVHYIEEHHYLPPADFLIAVERAGR